MNEFQERLEELLIENDISRLQLAKKIGTTSTTINGYFNKNYYPQIDIAINLANFFNCSLDYLLGLSDERISKYKIDENNAHSNFLENFKTLIEENCLSIAKAMRLLNISEYSYFRWQKGIFPKTINLICIAKYFEVSIDYLLGK